MVLLDAMNSLIFDAKHWYLSGQLSMEPVPEEGIIRPYPPAPRGVLRLKHDGDYATTYKSEQ